MPTVSAFHDFAPFFFDDRRFSRRRSAFFRLWNLFLMALSDLPGKSLRISDHLFPQIRWCSKRILSSSGVQDVFFNLSSRTLTYLSLTCSPVLPGKALAISTHLKPRDTIETIHSFSCFCQFPRMTPGFKY